MSASFVTPISSQILLRQYTITCLAQLEATSVSTCILTKTPSGLMVNFDRFILLESLVALNVQVGDLSRLIQTLLSSIIAHLRNSKSILASTTWLSKQLCWTIGHLNQSRREHTSDRERGL